ncbi:MAG TPA: long-chain fatty acid--CoA ligase, partial [Bacteroidales bacterium]|nr:long-chain fatty acid--CoA ligase [Bacteroidales bacterium]
LLPHYLQSFKPKDDVLAGKDNGKWIKYSITDYIAHAENISYGLLQLGIKPGDNIATISGSRPEWNLVDMGIQQAGAIHVPIYPTISESDYKYILDHAGVKVIFISGREIYRKIEHLLTDLPGIIAVYAFKETDGVKPLDELISLGRQNPQPETVNEIKAGIKPSDLATIIYTSGTTGNPKGVMLTHQNIISNFKAVKDIPPVGEDGRALSYLPLCHIYERMLVYLYQYLGISVYYAESPVTVGDNLREIQPDIFTTVPRLLEKVYEKIINSGRKLKGIKKIIFFWAVNVGMHYELNNARGPYYTLKLKIARKLVFSKWQEALGGKLKVIVSGGAALQPRLAHIFWAAGIPVLEGYGLTETSPVIAVNNFDENGVKFGTVGPVLKNTRVKIAEDHEILCKGPGIMLGYYKEPALTAEAVDSEGWFHTGDLGRIETEGHLKITGRKKELFKTSFGKYVSPEMIENNLKESEFIDSLMVVGENQKYAAAIVVPDFAHLRSWCQIKGIPYTSNKEMIEMERIKKRFHKEIHKYNKHLGATEQIKSFELLPTEWTVDSGELTATLKLRRSLINERYKTEIEKLFE